MPLAATAPPPVVNTVGRCAVAANEESSGMESHAENPRENTEAGTKENNAPENTPTETGQNSGSRELVVTLERMSPASVNGEARERYGEERIAERDVSDNSSDTPLANRRSMRWRSPATETIETRFSPEQRRIIELKVFEMKTQSSESIEARLVVWLNELERSRKISTSIQGAVSGSMKVNIRLVKEGTKILSQRATAAERSSSRTDELRDAARLGSEAWRENRDLRNLLNSRSRSRRSSNNTGTFTPEMNSMDIEYMFEDTDAPDEMGGSVGGGSIAERNSDRCVARSVVNLIGGALEKTRELLNPGTSLPGRGTGRGGVWLRPRDARSPYAIPRSGSGVGRGRQLCWCRRFDDFYGETERESEGYMDRINAETAVAAGHIASCSRFANRG